MCLFLGESKKCDNEELCDQICQKKDLSYECLCVDGYKAKGHKCIGINGRIAFIYMPLNHYRFIFVCVIYVSY